MLCVCVHVYVCVYTGQKLLFFAAPPTVNSPIYCWLADVLSMCVLIFPLDDSSDYVVVGVSSRVITEREASVCPKDQLADGQQFLTAKKPNNFSFTHDVSYSTLNSIVPYTSLFICTHLCTHTCMYAHTHTHWIHVTFQGSHIVTFSGKKLLVFDIENESSYRFV